MEGRGVEESMDAQTKIFFVNITFLCTCRHLERKTGDGGSCTRDKKSDKIPVSVEYGKVRSLEYVLKDPD